jgi:hypothetical protein
VKGGSRDILGFSGELKLVSPSYDTPHLYDGFTGRRYGNDLYINRQENGFPQVVVYNYTTDWLFQGGTTADAKVTQLGTFFNQFFNDVIRELYLRKELSFRDTQLTTANDFQTWCNAWCGCYATLRTLEACGAAAGLNASMQKIASAVGTRWVRIETDMRQILSYRVPPFMLEIVDLWHGVHTWEGVTETNVIIATQNSVAANAILDLTLVASIDTILTNVETLLATLTNSADAQIIANVFAIMYPRIQYSPKGIDMRSETWIGNWSRAVMAHATNVSYDTAPNTNYDNAQIPILVPDCAKDESAKKALLSLLRPAAYGTDPNASVTATANLIGVFFDNPSNLATPAQVGEYTENTVFSSGSVNAGVDLQWDSQALPMGYWAPYAARPNTTYNAPAADQRMYPGFHRVWMREDDLIDETFDALQKGFNTGKIL